MEGTEQSIEKSNSTEISINAKGQYSGKVKVYATTIEEAFNQAVEFSKQLENLIATKAK